MNLSFVHPEFHNSFYLIEMETLHVDCPPGCISVVHVIGCFVCVCVSHVWCVCVVLVHSGVCE